MCEERERGEREEWRGEREEWRGGEERDEGGERGSHNKVKVTNTQRE